MSRLRNKRNTLNVKIMLAVHVDHMIVASSDNTCNSLVRFLRNSLPTNSLGQLTYYTGGVFERDLDKATSKVIQTTC